ncbi:unnamed protein product [Brassica napus]|uniref:(rape) hypothetical protein n=1 Tax=Brassica napus TaxID=3708 RepID=A0A816JTJ3_BRANA|nr:unnamed protein product [Brassica napus]
MVLDKPESMIEKRNGSVIGLMETVNGSHQFTIKGYSLAKGMSPGRYIQSDVFSVNGYDWVIYFYPDGKNPEENSTGRGRHKRSTPQTVDVMYQVREVHWRNKACQPTTIINRDPSQMYFCRSGVCVEVCYGQLSRPVDRSLEVDKRLRAVCMGTSPIQEASYRGRPLFGGTDEYMIFGRISTTGFFIRFLFGLRKATGVTVLSSTVPLALLELALRVPNSSALCRHPQFYGPVGNNSVGRVVIEDMEPSIFQAMLSFIYTDVLPDVHEITGLTSTASFTNMIQHLLAAADLYDFGRLNILCEAFLCEELNVDNVATTLALADQHQFLQFKEFCLKFVASPANLRALMKSEGFKHLNQSCPSVLPELLNTVAAADKSSTSSGQSSKRRSVSSVLGCDTSTTNARKLRRT